MERLEKVIEILTEIDDSIDYSTEDQLIDGRMLDSFSIITLVGELEDAFDVTIEAVELVPENFNSAEAIAEMIERLEE